jgi:hypothetical protein
MLLQDEHLDLDLDLDHFKFAVGSASKPIFPILTYNTCKHTYFA